MSLCEIKNCKLSPDGKHDWITQRPESGIYSEIGECFFCGCKIKRRFSAGELVTVKVWKGASVQPHHEIFNDDYSAQRFQSEVEDFINLEIKNRMKPVMTADDLGHLNSVVYDRIMDYYETHPKWSSCFRPIVNTFKDYDNGIFTWSIDKESFK